MKYVKKAVRFPVDLYRRNPVRVTAVLAAVVVLVASQLGIVLPELSVLHALEVVLPTLLGGELAHRKVTPV